MLQVEGSIHQATTTPGITRKDQRADLPRHPSTERKTMDIARDLFETLKSVCALLHDAEVKCCLIGGLAVGILAKPRATEDIDLLILIEENKLPSLTVLLKKKFEVIQERNIMHFEKATIYRTILGSPAADKTGLVIVDFILADNDLYREAVLNPLNLIVDDVIIPVAKHEYLIKIKNLSNRPQDLLDIASLKEVLEKSGI